MRNWIQDHAMEILVRAKSASLKELIPQNVEPNLFSYHLKQLIAEGYIHNISRGRYGLTARGHALAGSLSTKTKRASTSPKSVIMFYVKDPDSLLLWRWSRQPYIGKVTLPYDRIKLGQDLNDAMKVALQEKLNLPADTPTLFRTSGMVRIYTDDILVSHMNAYVYTVNTEEKVRPFDGRNGQLFWSFTPHLQSQDLMEGHDQLIAAIERPHSAPFDIRLNY